MSPNASAQSSASAHGGIVHAKAGDVHSHDAASAGHADAQKVFGALLWHDEKQAPSRAAFDEAYGWLQKAANQGAASGYWAAKPDAPPPWAPPPSPPIKDGTAAARAAHTAGRRAAQSFADARRRAESSVAGKKAADRAVRRADAEHRVFTGPAMQHAGTPLATEPKPWL